MFDDFSSKLRHQSTSHLDDLAMLRVEQMADSLLGTYGCREEISDGKMANQKLSYLFVLVKYHQLSQKLMEAIGINYYPWVCSAVGMAISCVQLS